MKSKTPVNPYGSIRLFGGILGKMTSAFGTNRMRQIVQLFMRVVRSDWRVQMLVA